MIVSWICSVYKRFRRRSRKRWHATVEYRTSAHVVLYDVPGKVSEEQMGEIAWRAAKALYAELEGDPHEAWITVRSRELRRGMPYHCLVSCAVPLTIKWEVVERAVRSAIDHVLTEDDLEDRR